MSRTVPVLLVAVFLLLAARTPVDSACCYFAAKDKDIAQPAQKAFITWDPKRKIESFTVQPKFEGNAVDFGMVIPTPTKPKLDDMPRDFFRHLAVFTVLKNREFPRSKLMPVQGGGFQFGGFGQFGQGGMGMGGPPQLERPPAVKVVESGVVGNLEFKIVQADKADALYTWLKDHKYQYAGDEATLDHYVMKKWFFTVMKIDPMQMKKKADGTYSGEITPTRFEFETDKLVYPLRITRISVKDTTEALFYVQAPYKVDLPDDLTYQYQWIPMLKNAQGWYGKGTFGTAALPGKGDDWLKAGKPYHDDLLKRGEELGFAFASQQRPKPNKNGRTATTLEWAKLLTAADIKILKGQLPYSEEVPDVDAGLKAADFKDARTAKKAQQIVEQRLQALQKLRPGGFLVREVPEKEIKDLKNLSGHLQEGQFLTKIRKTFTRGEMDDDLLIVPAKLGKAVDDSEYEEILPTSPP